MLLKAKNFIDKKVEQSYASRSEFIRDLVREAIVEDEWKDELLKRDIYSSLSIPVEKNGEVYAVISVYSIIPFYFKKEFV